MTETKTETLITPNGEPLAYRALIADHAAPVPKPGQKFEGAEFERVTLYRSGEMMGNYTALECRYVSIRVTKYAQYDHAVEVTFMKKGARKARRFFLTYAPSLVVVDGFDAFKPDGIFGASETVTHANGGTVSVSKGRHTGFGAGWKSDFERGLMEWADVTRTDGQWPILADFHGWNAHRGVIGAD